MKWPQKSTIDRERGRSEFCFSFVTFRVLSWQFFRAFGRPRENGREPEPHTKDAKDAKGKRLKWPQENTIERERGRETKFFASFASFV